MTNVITVPIAARSAGTITSPSATIPANTSVVRVTLNLNAADKIQPVHPVVDNFRIEISEDLGVTWTTHVAGSWSTYGPGGYTSRDGTVNPDPWVQCGVVGLDGQLIRFVVSLLEAFDAGATVSVG